MKDSIAITEISFLEVRHFIHEVVRVVPNLTQDWLSIEKRPFQDKGFARSPAALNQTRQPTLAHILQTARAVPADCFDKSDEDPGFCASYDCASQGAVRCPGATPQCMPRVSTLANDVPGHEFRNRYGGFFGPIPDGVASAICDGVKDCEVGFIWQ